MPRLLDIIVPHYTETWDVVRPLFDILNAQKMIDFNQFRVILVHDGVTKFSNRYFDGPLQVQQCRIEHKGVSAARNAGLDQANATWVSFCDCDDCYTSIYSLLKIFYILNSPEADQFDLMWSPFYMTPIGNGNLVKSTEFNPVFMHNKYYRLSFLRENDIRFCEDLYMSEDSAFNMLVKLEMAPNRIGQINVDEPLYSWCRRKDSITMDFSKWLSNTEGHFDRNLYVISEYKKRGVDISKLVARTVTDAYAMLNKKGVKGDQTAFRKRLFNFIMDNQIDFLNVSNQDKSTMLAASDKDAGITSEEKLLRLPFDGWIIELIKECAN